MTSIDDSTKNMLATIAAQRGPWINAAKQAIRDNLPDHTVIAVPGAGTVTLGALRTRAFRTGKGQHIAYVTDAADTGPNRTRIIGLARAADQLFIEAAFFEADRPVAAATCHLTARAAGEIAREAGAKRAIPFHFSARYGANTANLAAEFHAAFAAL